MSQENINTNVDYDAETQEKEVLTDEEETENVIELKKDPWYKTPAGSNYISSGITVLGFLITVLSIRTVKKMIKNTKYKTQIEHIIQELESIIKLDTTSGISATFRLTEKARTDIIGQFNELKKISNKSFTKKIDNNIDTVQKSQSGREVRTCVRNMITEIGEVIGR